MMTSRHPLYRDYVAKRSTKGIRCNSRHIVKRLMDGHLSVANQWAHEEYFLPCLPACRVRGSCMKASSAHPHMPLHETRRSCNLILASYKPTLVPYPTQTIGMGTPCVCKLFLKGPLPSKKWTGIGIDIKYHPTRRGPKRCRWVSWWNDHEELLPRSSKRSSRRGSKPKPSM